MGPVRYLCAADPACALAALVAAPATTFLSSAVAEQAFTVTPRGTTFAPQCTALAAPGSSPAGRSIPAHSQGTAANAAASQHIPWPVPCRSPPWRHLASPSYAPPTPVSARAGRRPTALARRSPALCRCPAGLSTAAALLDRTRLCQHGPVPAPGHCSPVPLLGGPALCHCNTIMQLVSTITQLSSATPLPSRAVAGLNHPGPPPSYTRSRAEPR